jgi:hypothetical protein
MKFFFSNETHGFYLDLLHGSNIPEDAIELQEGEHEKALEWQAAGGLITSVNADGTMVLESVEGD